MTYVDPGPLCGSPGCPADITLLSVVSIPTTVPLVDQPGLPTDQSANINSTQLQADIILVG